MLRAMQAVNMDGHRFDVFVKPECLPPDLYELRFFVN
jgi:hypothetical protein